MNPTLIKIFSVFIILLFNKNVVCQSFTEQVFKPTKAMVDTSENEEKLKTCSLTFERLLIGEPNDSLINYYWILNQTKIAYLVLDKYPNTSLSFIDNTKSKIKFIDTTYNFGAELKIICLLQKIIFAKANKTKENELFDLEKEIDLCYLQNKKNARAGLIYAYFIYQFNINKKKNVALQLLNTSMALFEKEKNNNQQIKWGSYLAKNLLKKITGK